MVFRLSQAVVLQIHGSHRGHIQDPPASSCQAYIIDKGKCFQFYTMCDLSPEFLNLHLDDPGRVVCALYPHTLSGHLLIRAAVKMLVIEPHHA